ncbi:MAG: hypothetical protein RLY78_3084 [Pseudomonadota bacterium]|jgi:small multidrug resistance pump|uniref:SMR family transporter n=1 Tax=Pseudaquabacterium rugosum TaxID=2984194 RepID=A0ABU9BA66_9BURK
MNVYWILGGAIAIEVVATALLKASDGFTRLWPTLGALAGFGTALYALTLVMRVVPTGIAYAIWSAVGIVLTSLVSWIVFKQRLDGPAIAGMGLIILGVLVIHLFSDSVGH